MCEYKLYLGDCKTIIPSLSGVDAILADPPYGRNYNPKRGGDSRRRFMRGIEIFDPKFDQIVGEDTPFDPSHLLGFDIVCLWGANHFADKLPSRSGWFIWDKRYGVTSNDQSDCEMAWTNRNKAARIYRQLWNGIIREGIENNMISGEKLHPHQKPEALMKWCLEQLKIDPGMTVLDPYMGSGTTGVACLKMGVSFIGCEIDKKYFDVAEARLEKASKWIPLGI